MTEITKPRFVAVGPGQQVLPKGGRLGPAQVAQLDRAVSGAGFQAEFGEAEKSRGQRLDNVDRLQPLEWHLLAGLEDCARLHAQLFFVDDKPGEVPADESNKSGKQDDDRDGRQQPGQIGDGEAGLVTTVWNDLAGQAEQDGEQNDPAADERGQWMRPLGLLDSRRLRSSWCKIRRGALRRGGLAHSPDWWASPSSVSRSLNLAASSGVSPGIVAFVLGLAVFRLTDARPKARSNGPDS